MEEEKVTSQFYEPAASLAAKDKNQYCKPLPDSEGVRVEFPTKGFGQCPRIHLCIYGFAYSLSSLVFWRTQNFQTWFSNSRHDVGVEANTPDW